VDDDLILVQQPFNREFMRKLESRGENFAAKDIVTVKRCHRDTLPLVTVFPSSH
jgi:hypothetical protein